MREQDAADDDQAAAREVCRLLPTIMRQLFSIDDDPAAELPLVQLRVCAMLADGPRSMTSLRRELNVSLSAVTQLADRLERSGLVERVAAGSDRRVRQLRLTAVGARIIRFQQQARLDCVDRVLAAMSPQARRRTLSALRSLVRAAGAARTASPVRSRGKP